MTRARFFLRVSTDRQDEQNQVAGCERRAAYGDAGTSWVTGQQYRTKVSGSGPEHEVDPARVAALADARAGQYEVLVVWALDRWTRGGILALFGDVEALKKCGVRLVSVQEPWAENELLLAIAAWQAQQEKLRRAERTKAALAHKRGQIQASGGYWRAPKGPGEAARWVSSLGRPRREIGGPAVVRALALRVAGMSWRDVAAELKREGLATVPARTLQRRCEAVGERGAADGPPKAA